MHTPHSADVHLLLHRARADELRAEADRARAVPPEPWRTRLGRALVATGLRLLPLSEGSVRLRAALGECLRPAVPGPPLPGSCGRPPSRHPRAFPGSCGRPPLRHPRTPSAHSPSRNRAGAGPVHRDERPI